jgi:hypothetical protein
MQQRHWPMKTKKFYNIGTRSAGLWAAGRHSSPHSWSSGRASPSSAAPSSCRGASYKTQRKQKEKHFRRISTIYIKIIFVKLSPRPLPSPLPAGPPLGDTAVELALAASSRVLCFLKVDEKKKERTG